MSKPSLLLLCVAGRLVAAMGLFAVTSLASGCSGISDPSGVAVVEIQRADGQPITAAVSWPYSVVLKAVALNSRRQPVAAQHSLAWSTSDETILVQSHRAVSDGTLFETKGVGTVTVTATVDGRSASATIQVDLAETADVWAWPDTSRMLVGTSRTLVVREVRFGSPISAGDGVRWESADPSVATVDQQGKVTTVGEGHTTITAAVGGRTIPAEVFVFRYPSPLRFASVAVGYHPVSNFGLLQRVCAVTTDGVLYCWGFAPFFATLSDELTDRCMRVRMMTTGRILGTGVGRCSVVPVAVRPDIRFTSVTMNHGDTCALATDGSAYCWGASPAAVEGELRFRSIDLGSGYPFQSTACALTTSDLAYCWGDNQYGQLGNGTAVLPGSVRPPPTPTPVAGGLRFRSITAGATVCGITTDGATYCWGSNVVSQAGVPVGTDTKSPVRVMGDPGFVQVEQAERLTCALDAGGSAFCWGAIGSGTGAPTPAPVAVSGGLRFANLVAHKPCGVTLEGAVYCWNADLIPAQVDIPFPTRAYWSSAVRFALGTDGLLRWWDYAPNKNPATTFFDRADVPDGLVIGSSTPALVPGQE